MKYIVAVSGGVDSVALLDMLAKQGGHELVVAHFDHGIRPESDGDARFVEGLAHKYNLPFELRREELGKDASEEVARDRRYAFLRELAKKHRAEIVTAHHLDDLVETIVINIERGTGWRGLAVLNAGDISRPLLQKTKLDIYTYALTHGLEWVEDETNLTYTYHRNQVRRRMYGLSLDSKQRLFNLRAKQAGLSSEIDSEAAHLNEVWASKRYPYCMINQPEAIEILRTETKGQLTRPQLKALWLAVKTAKPGKKYESGNGILITFSLDEFQVSMI
jgi:tRNA(Ile)-lysidine synthase